jgi:dTDP-4-dehydrorhamnose reductase
LATVPYKEDAITDPQSVYGLSKKMGEEETLKNDPDAVIIRTSWVYSKHGSNFVKTMIRLMNEKESISVVSDQHGTPTWAADIASAIMQIVNANNWVPGIYNFSNDGETTWYDFAVEIKKSIGSKCIVNPIPTSSYPTPAKRPHYSVLNKEKIVSVYQVKLKDWRESLRNCIEGL